ncbi:TolC family protein [Pseudomonas sp. H11T01]|uniref:TolC family protein n=1 Tax=Pseudomonas sp. H11T01 TaxID=3402749 RepID=UPI003AD66EBF
MPSHGWVHGSSSRRPTYNIVNLELAHEMHRSARAWGLGPSITWAAFDLGSVRARIRGANANAEGALATYEQQVLLALEESENAFSDYGKRQQRLLSLIKQSESSRAAADLAAIQYQEGTVDYLVLLDAQRERLSAEDAQALGEVDQYRGIVAIYKALGGSWDSGDGRVAGID